MYCNVCKHTIVYEYTYIIVVMYDAGILSFLTGLQVAKQNTATNNIPM